MNIGQKTLNLVWSVWDSYNYTGLGLLPGLVLNLCLSDPCDLELKKGLYRLKKGKRLVS